MVSGNKRQTLVFAILLTVAIAAYSVISDLNLLVVVFRADPSSPAAAPPPPPVTPTAAPVTIKDGPLFLNLTYVEEFQKARNIVNRPWRNGGPKTAYKQCLEKFEVLPGALGDSYAQMDVREQRTIAERFWLRQDGKLWMQHSRKAGGTTLCMSLRLNQHGLIRTANDDWKPPKRETCQMTDFCRDCDLTKAKSLFPSPSPVDARWERMPRLINCATSAKQRNFAELEGTVSPPNLLTHPEWSDFVFISTLRHPLARIVSSLHNDHPYVAKSSNCTKSRNSLHLNPCAHRAIASEAAIMSRCHSIYYCYSNYFVRMFAGHSSNTTAVTRDTLAAAQRNFLRYSCVILQERFDETSECLRSKLGLHLKSEAQFNVAGSLVESKGASSPTKIIAHSDDDFLRSFSGDEYARLKDLNSLDIEFYEWAKARILSDSGIGDEAVIPTEEGTR